MAERLHACGPRTRRFMLPSFVVSEGVGLHALELIFPDDEAQVWLANNVFPDYGIEPDGDLAAIHEARNMLWGVWANAALLADEGRSEEDVAGYMSRWALLGEQEVGPALASLRAPGMEVYVLAYYHGWRLLRTWLDAGDRQERVRRLLTEQVLPADLR